MLVSDPEGIPDTPYHETQPEILVRYRDEIQCTRCLLNHSGRWEEVLCPRDALLNFEAFFDWDQVGVKDYKYVRVKISTWPSRVELLGREALIEYEYVVFERRTPTSAT